MALILEGRSDASICRALDLHRTTLYRWKNFDQYFVAELNRRRIALWERADERLRLMFYRSMNVVDRAIRSKDPAVALPTATRVFNKLAPKQIAPPTRSPDPDVVINQMADTYEHRHMFDHCKPAAARR